ncbi:Epidermis-specific secreted glycoprotein EP1 [Morus notabilis]|uniref:Epidermis-specific secreted glycoprotein EP1 n=1 Tax=Morus notabilis TaxID=981085 RepID=W9SNF9_9ROSA|nr:EP1-like glycoprotein 3 [Morus notabilis]EXC18475.1 Epidermis-specific secreted glycoprotein EP1 [Morus notabilis]
MSPLSSHPTLLVFLLSLFVSTSIAQAKVPPNATFQFKNEGYYGDFLYIEYGATYRFFSDIFVSPFTICFYNTTPNAYTLALRMGLTDTRRTTLRWVWEANRGNPVGENATFTFGGDGNLVLANADGRVAWQSNTANKGVVGFKLLPTGNMVLHDSKGNFVWQSFDYPTDTILVGQSLRVGGPNKLVSRLSEKENKDGPYSLVIESKGSMSLYYKSKNSPKPLLYYTSGNFVDINNVTFEFEEDVEAGAYFLRFNPYIIARTFYNASLTFIRLEIDGNIKLYTYNLKVVRRAFVLTYSFFDRQAPRDEDECQLPSRCRTFGLCEDSQCVACPTKNGLAGWSASCAPEKLTSCKPSDFHYYKIVGVDHFLCKYTSGEAIKESACEKKCTADCKCLGYFYNRETSSCWAANELRTLTKVANSTHVGFIKAPN